MLLCQIYKEVHADAYQNAAAIGEMWFNFSRSVAAHTRPVGASMLLIVRRSGRAYMDLTLALDGYFAI